MDTNKTTTHIVKIIRITVDAGMYILFLLLMGYHLFENLHHEILGATVFVLFFIHNGLNWRWYKNLFKGKYTLSRSLQTGCNLLLCAAMLCTIASALMLSRDVFYFLNLTNSGLGRVWGGSSTWPPPSGLSCWNPFTWVSTGRRYRKALQRK